MKKILLIISNLMYFASSGQDTKIRFFGQPDMVYQHSSETNPVTNTTTNKSQTNFNGAGFVIFITSQINDRLSILGESDAHYNSVDKKFNFEVERLFLRYYYKDYLSFRAGRMYTPIGYWNNQYNLGLILQPTIFRPYHIRAAHDGGTIQTRDIGFQVEGENMTSLRFFYQVMFANGVGYFGANDKPNNNIAISGKIGLEPIDGLKFIISGQSDYIQKGISSPTGIIQNENGKLWIGNAAIAFMNPEKKFEFIGEYYHQFNQYDSSGTCQSIGYFAYTGYKITDSFIPYLVFNHSMSGTKNNPDPYFAMYSTDNKIASVGARYKLNAGLVVKFEYEFNLQTVKDVPTPVGNKDFSTLYNRARLQFAFSF